MSVPSWLDRNEYPFTSRWQSLSRGARMHYVDEGSGPVLLFAHGTPTWSFEWRHLIRVFSQRYRCVAPDMLGMGLSDRPADFAYTPEAHAAALREFVVGLDLRDVTLIAHDFGGPISLPLALESDTRVTRVVLINTWAWSFDGDAEMNRKARIAGGAAGRWLYRYANFSLRVLMPGAYGNRRALTPAIHRQYLEVFRDRASRVQVLWQFARALSAASSFYRDTAERIGQLHGMPVLIIWGMKDMAFPPRFLAEWRRRLPHAQVAELPEAGHWPHEEAPEAVSRALRDFLEADSGAAVPGSTVTSR